MLKKILLGLFILLLGIIIFYFLGPKPFFTPIDKNTAVLAFPLHKLDSFVSSIEAEVKDIKPDNEARIVWADSIPSKTEYVLLYLHGFSASQEEGNPIHRDFAKNYGCNLFLSRLHDHGRSSDDSFKELTPDNYFESAQKALSIAKLLGEKVIIMSCSTGGTLSIMLAETNPEIHSFIMYSPNIDIKDPTSDLVTGHWGYQLTKAVLGGEYNHVTYKPDAQKYWNSKYHINGIITVKSLINGYMKDEYFKKIKQPLFVGYYYKDEENQDNVVSVPDMVRFFNAVSTPENAKRKISFSQAHNHVICGRMQSEDIANVRFQTFKFAEDILKLKPKNPNNIEHLW